MSRRASSPELLVLPTLDNLEALPFLLTRDKWKTIRITVRADGAVHAKAPFRTTSAEVLRAVSGKRPWIEAKREFFRQRGLPPVRTYAEGEEFFYLGRPFRLRLLPDPFSRLRSPRASLQGNTLEVRGKQLTPLAVCKAIHKWRQEIAVNLLSKRTTRLHARACRLLGDNPPQPALRIRSLKRRWGSCTAKGEISLARQLSALSLEAVDYVIIHELCHLRQLNHSPRFHALLERVLPGARQKGRRLQALSASCHMD